MQKNTCNASSNSGNYKAEMTMKSHSHCRNHKATKKCLRIIVLFLCISHFWIMSIKRNPGYLPLSEQSAFLVNGTSFFRLVHYIACLSDGLHVLMIHEASNARLTLGTTKIMGRCEAETFLLKLFYPLSCLENSKGWHTSTTFSKESQKITSNHF